MKYTSQSGGGVEISDGVLYEKSGFRKEGGAIRVSISYMYEGWRIYDVSRMGGTHTAHMDSTASVGGWGSTLFRAKLIFAKLYDN